MYNPLINKYADVLVNYSTKVSKGDLVIIYARGYSCQPLVKEIYKLCLKNGANPIVRTSMDELAETFIKYASDEQLEYIDEMSKIEVERADVMIFIGAPNNIKNMANADNSKLAKRSKATLPILSKRLERSASGDMRWVIADYPTNALAQEANMSLEEYKAIHPIFEEDIYEAVSLKTCVENRLTAGGPAPEAMKAVIENRKEWLATI